MIITSRIAACDQLTILRANIPFFVVIVAVLLILIALPQISTWLPSMMRN